MSNKPLTAFQLAESAMSRLGYWVTEAEPSANPKTISVWDGSPFDENSQIIAALKFDFVTGEWSGPEELVEAVKATPKGAP